MEETKDNKVNRVNDAYNEAQPVWSPWSTQAKEDYEFYMSKQWSDGDTAELLRKGRPVLSLNYIKKNVDVISGSERQNKSDIKILPIEGGDVYISEILTHTIKWIMLQGSNEFIKSQSFKDGLITGVGWLEPIMNFDDDPVNGDIYLKKVSPFEIIIDPHFTELDLSDADYIIRQKILSKDKAKVLYPDSSDEIDKCSGTIPADVEHQSVPNDRGKKVLVVEYWHRVYETITFVIDASNPGDIREWEGSDKELKVVLADNPNFKAIKQKVPRIKLTTVIDKSVLVYDGPGPHSKKMWPFIPIFCFCESSYPDLTLKLQGIVRSLKDVQREKNKRRSNIMAAVGTIPTSGWMVAKGSVDDINVIRNSAGAGKTIEYNASKPAPQPIGPIEISQSLIQLEMMFGDDLRQIGSNPDLLGMQQGKNDPGITIQLRQKQGMTAIQEIYDSLSYATRMLGRKILELISENWDHTKIQRIAGDYLPFEQRRKEVGDEIKKLQAQYMQVQPPTTAGMVPENIEDETVLMNVENQRLAAENMKMEIQRQIKDLGDLIQAITDEEKEFWNKFDELKESSRFDVTVDETTNTPTTRIANLAAVTQAAQYNVPIPPEAIVDLMDISKTQKDRIFQYIEQQKQMAMQAAMPPMPPPQGTGQ